MGKFIEPKKRKNVNGIFDSRHWLLLFLDLVSLNDEKECSVVEYSVEILAF